MSSTTEVAIENSRLHAENSALRITCGMWRRRAEVHGAATLGLLGFARTARDEAIKMRRERDDLYKHYNLLREKLPPDEFSFSNLALIQSTMTLLTSSWSQGVTASASANAVDGH
ncbi:hypothetical protein D9615_007386 [Tricholomella constricta]|uniref:Uncharacterized protein n=1 Tax=Tricholomella constricta TaxID=117010 RepID=A0A8H5GY20_9AGAR|nr:hypothetical protein D9615_007386 [Tricholomella constricta]